MATKQLITTPQKPRTGSTAKLSSSATGTARKKKTVNSAKKAKPTPRERRVIATDGHQGATVSIIPRDGHPRQAQVEWRDRATRKRKRRAVKGVTLSATGTAVDKDQRSVLTRLASLLHTRLTNGEPMPGDPAFPGWSILLASASKSRSANDQDSASADTLTVREAMAVAYGPSYADKRNANGRISGRHVHGIKGEPSGGLAVSTWTEHARELRRLADIVEEVLGATSSWDSSHAAYTRLRDALIRRAKGHPGAANAQRFRQTQKALQVFIRATRLVATAYLERDDLKQKPKALTVQRWLRDLKTAWGAAKLQLPHDDKKRYTRREAGRIYAEASNCDDRRYALWLLLGMEGRPTQILRAMRSHLLDSDVAMPRGVFRGPGTELKHGLTYAPTPAHRIEINRFLRAGYLREFEERYQRDKRKDYPLFPSHAPVNGVIPYRPNARPWGYRQLLGFASECTGYYAIESKAGVKNVPGRGPYALKYTMADLAPIVASGLGISDPVIINLVTAHDTPGMAPQYRKKARKDPLILTKVGQIIWGIRKDLAMAEEESMMESHGVALEPEQIEDYDVRPGGVQLRTMKGESLWVPWNALKLDGEDLDAVDQLIRLGGHYGPSTVDDDAREISFEGLAVLNLDRMLARARAHDGGDPGDDAAFRNGK